MHVHGAVFTDSRNLGPGASQQKALIQWYNNIIKTEIAYNSIIVTPLFIHTIK